MTFRKGLIDATPIFAGYFSVSFAFGISAINYGHPPWSPVLLTLTHCSGTGQFAVIDLLHAGSGFWSIVAAVTVINLRYILMALSVAQRLPPGIGAGRRLAIALGDTDEIVGMAVRQPRLSFPYYMGLFVCAFSGWILGTVLGAAPAIGRLLPADLVSALGIALYAMFIAIIIPEARAKRPVLLCSALAAAIGIGLRLAPVKIDSGWTILIAGVSAAVLSAVLFPKRPTSAEDAGKEAAQ